MGRKWRTEELENAMLKLSREYVAYLLAGYGELDASAAILKTSDETFHRVREAANRGAEGGKEWLKVACRAAIEVVEGESRELRRRQLVESDMPRELLADHHRDIAARIGVFSGGAPVKKKEVVEGLTFALAQELPGYKHVKSRSQFVKTFPGGNSCVSLHRGRGAAYLSFGVTHDGVEGAERRLFGPRSPLAQRIHYPKTLVVSSLNISPRNHYWPNVIDGSWLILGVDGIRLASAEAVTLVRDVVLPFIAHNQMPARIRDTLLSTRGNLASVRPARTVFAIDYLERRRDWLEADLALFEERFQDFSQENREKMQSEYRAAAERWDSVE
jgi:hypothetical protein